MDVGGFGSLMKEILRLEIVKLEGHIFELEVIDLQRALVISRFKEGLVVPLLEIEALLTDDKVDLVAVGPVRNSDFRRLLLPERGVVLREDKFTALDFFFILVHDFHLLEVRNVLHGWTGSTRGLHPLSLSILLPSWAVLGFNGVDPEQSDLRLLFLAVDRHVPVVRSQDRRGRSEGHFLFDVVLILEILSRPLKF